MPFASPKLIAQGHPLPTNTTLPYPITADYGYVLFYSVLTPAMTSTLYAGHIVTATIQQNGLQPPANTPYPRVPFHTYTYTRNGRPNDVLGAELQNPAAYPLNTDHLIRIGVADSAGVLIGQCAVTRISFT